MTADGTAERRHFTVYVERANAMFEHAIGATDELRYRQGTIAAAETLGRRIVGLGHHCHLRSLTGDVIVDRDHRVAPATLCR